MTINRNCIPLPAARIANPRLRFFILLFVILLSGCVAQSKSVVVMQASSGGIPDHRAYLIHLPGIGGLARVDDWMVAGLRDGGLEADLFMFNWVGDDRGIKALTRYKRNHELAKELSERIASISMLHPDQRIIISAHSAGNGVLVWALEDLPDGVMADTVLMLSPALSPTYDLTRAFKHIRRKVYVFYSDDDDFVLGTGTSVFGTMDGVKTEAAGNVGFKKPADGDPQQYLKLEQFPYDESWERWGHNGGHLGSMQREFAREVLAPVLLHGKLNPTTQESNAP